MMIIIRRLKKKKKKKIAQTCQVGHVTVSAVDSGIWAKEAQKVSKYQDLVGELNNKENWNEGSPSGNGDPRIRNRQ